MNVLRKYILITFFLSLLIYSTYLLKSRLGIDVYESRHAGDYISAIVHPQRIANAMPPSSPSNLKVYDSQPGPATIRVDVRQANGTVNNRIFGNNIIAYDPTTYENRAKEYYGYSDYGAGIWNPKWNEPSRELIDLAQQSGITVVRFPGGSGSKGYDWKQAIGRNRIRFLFGIDEFIKAANSMSAEPLLTLSYFIGDENTDAELVEYLNSPNDGSNFNGGIDWAAERARNGHPESYHVKYFEVGNEVYSGYHDNKVTAEEYATRYLRYYETLKKVDPSIQIGVVLNDLVWNRNVIEIVKDKVDFGIIHTYPSPASGEELEAIPARDIYKFSLARPMIQDEYSFREVLALLKAKAGRDVPLAITEFNGGFVQEKPVPYRHALGTALLNAELLRIFLKPENNILMANYWQFNNSYWGMIANGFDGSYQTIYNPYFKRPNYYVFEMYANHFGKELISAEVVSPGDDISRYSFYNAMIKYPSQGRLENGNLLTEPWNISAVKGVQVSQAGDILAIDFGDHEQWNYYHTTRTTEVEPNTFYRLSGFIKTDNLVADTGVCLEMQDARGWTKTLSAASTEKVKGSINWHYVETIYKTLPDAKAVRTIARRIGEKGPLKGKAYFKDVKLVKFVPSVDTHMPYLSVNASRNKDGSKVYLMVVNKNLDESMTATIELKYFSPAAKGNAWVLNGPSIDATNEKKHDNVKVSHREFEIKANPFEYTFEPHSVSAIEIEGSRVGDDRK